jgi:signal transduction histidine kinase
VAVDQSSAEPRLFNLEQYIQDILMSLRPKLKRTSHEIKVEMDSSIELFCDPGIISQVITNLLMNSLNHAYGPNDNGHIVIGGNLIEDMLRVTYSDDGHGIEPDILKRLFDPFVTTKRGQGGSGLGTHIIYNLVTQGLKGRIQCFSEVGQGTRFEITVPMASVSVNADQMH